jgi:hypothetical protein
MGPIRNPRWEQKRTEGYVIVSNGRWADEAAVSRESGQVSVSPGNDEIEQIPPIIVCGGGGKHKQHWYKKSLTVICKEYQLDHHVNHHRDT